MRSPLPSARISVLTVLAAFVAGVAADHFTQREAQAQSLSTATLYVPAGGLVFRAPDGTPLARLSRDSHGGTFELFDDRREVSTRMPTATSMSPSPAPYSYEIEEDPWPLHAPASKDEFKRRF